MNHIDWVMQVDLVDPDYTRESRLSFISGVQSLVDWDRQVNLLTTDYNGDSRTFFTLAFILDFVIQVNLSMPNYADESCEPGNT